MTSPSPIVLDNSAGHLASPHLALQRDGTLLCIYGRGHGGKGPLLKKSVDGGRNWTSVSLAQAEPPTKNHSVFCHSDQGDGEHTVAFGVQPRSTGQTGFDLRQLNPVFGRGAAWSAVEDIKACEVAPRSLVVFDGGRKLLTLYHTVNPTSTSTTGAGDLSHGGRKHKRTTIWQASSTDSGRKWKHDFVSDSDSEGYCEPCLIERDGKILALLRAYNDDHVGGFVVANEREVFSEGGRAWSNPKSLPGALDGDAHSAAFSQDRSSLVVCYRQRIHAARANPHGCHYFMGWAGTFEDIQAESHASRATVLLSNDGFEQHNCNNLEKNGGRFVANDCGYSGLVCLRDGTFVAVAHTTLSESCPSIYCLRFTLSRSDNGFVFVNAP